MSPSQFYVKVIDHLHSFNYRVRKTSIYSSDIEDIYSSHIKYIENLSISEIENRLLDISTHSNDKLNALDKLFVDKGLLLFKEYIPSSILCECKKTFDSIVKSIDGFNTSGNKSFETDLALFSHSDSLNLNYNQLVNFGKTIFFIRHGVDEGMVDIFNVDKFDKSFFDLKEYLLKSSFFLYLLSKYNFTTINLNLYINRGVSHTRNFHFDSKMNQFKFFVYMSDCLALSDGPFVYVKGSHKNTMFSIMNHKFSHFFKSRTDTPFVSLLNVVPLLGKSGSAFIANQSGSHFGFPQKSGSTRFVAVLSLK